MRNLGLYAAVVAGGIAGLYPLLHAAKAQPLPLRLLVVGVWLVCVFYLGVAAMLHGVRESLRRLDGRVLRDLQRNEASNPAWQITAGHALAGVTALLGALAAKRDMPALGLVAIATGVIGGHLLARAMRRQWLNETPAPLHNRLPPHGSFAELVSDLPERTKQDPLLPARVAGFDIFIAAHRHLESRKLPTDGVALLYAVGALAGHAVQAHYRQFVRDKLGQDAKAFVDVELATGEHLVMAEGLNDLMTKGELSFWELALDACRYQGGQPNPDFALLAARVMKTAGTPEFGLSPAIMPSPADGTPRQWLDALWSETRARAERIAPMPGLLLLAYNIAAQTAIQRTSDKLGAVFAFEVIAEAAQAMSKVELEGEETAV